MRVMRAIGLLLAGAVVAACSGGGSVPSSQSMLSAIGNAGSSPDGRTRELLYAADLTQNSVYVYSYPGGTLKRTLTGFQAVHYECVDGAGNIFIADTGASKVLEYARGSSKPVHAFKTPGNTPNGCAIDPATGNLAVSYDPLGSGPGGILIYKHAMGEPTAYSTPNVFRYYFIGYDAGGNLFVDGTDMHVTFELAELPAGAHATQAIALDQKIVLPGAIQWDGQYLAIGDQVCIDCASTIYRFSISGGNGSVVGSVPLTDSCDVLQFWIHKSRVVTANDCGASVKYFSYPSGGHSLKSLGPPLSQPVGVTISAR
jgi:hypothetical protein